MLNMKGRAGPWMESLRENFFRSTLGYFIRQQDTQISAATVMPNTVRKEALLLRRLCTWSPTKGPTAMPMDTVKAKRLMPSVTLAGGSTSPARVMVAEPHTEYTTPMYSRTTISRPNTGKARKAGNDRQKRVRKSRYT